MPDLDYMYALLAPFSLFLPDTYKIFLSTISTLYIGIIIASVLFGDMYICFHSFHSVLNFSVVSALQAYMYFRKGADTPLFHTMVHLFLFLLIYLLTG